MSKSLFVFVLIAGAMGAALLPLIGSASPVARPEHDPGPGYPAGDIHMSLKDAATPRPKKSLRARSGAKKRRPTASLGGDEKASRLDMESAVRHLNQILSASRAAPTYRLPSDALRPAPVHEARADE